MGLDADVTRRELSLGGTRDSTTGWRPKSYTESTVKAISEPHGATNTDFGVGFYSRMDMMFLMADPLDIGGQILKGGKYYEVATVQQHKPLDSHVCYVLQCHALPMWQGAPTTTATWKTAPADARANIKAWIDARVTDANIVKDDGSTQASWACLFANPPYPLELEFRGTSNLNGAYVVGQPRTKPLIDPVEEAAYAYEEHVPIDIYTVDSTGCAGDPLLARMSIELRSVAETYVTGSLLGLEQQEPKAITLGSMKLYNLRYTLNYRRDTTT